MNTFGKIFKVSIFGESHGNSVGIVIDGVPAGIPIVDADFEADSARRKSGAKGTTPRQEADVPRIMSGVFNDHTTGAPLMILFENTNTRSRDYSFLKETPRPGHADFVASQKYGVLRIIVVVVIFLGVLPLELLQQALLLKKLLHL
jgi:chorismate synthase